MSLKHSETGDGWKPSMCLLQYSAEIKLLLSHISYRKFLYSTYFFFVLPLCSRKTYPQISEAEADYQEGKQGRSYKSLKKYQMKISSREFFFFKIYLEERFAYLCLKHLILWEPKLSCNV